MHVYILETYSASHRAIHEENLLECNRMNINIGWEEGKQDGSDGVLCIPDPHRIGPESRGSRSILISAACPLKISLSPVKHPLRLVTQTKPIKIPDWKDGLICFSILLIIHHLASFFFFFSSLLSHSPPLLSLFCFQRERGVSHQSAYIFCSFPQVFFFFFFFFFPPHQLCCQFWSQLRVLPTAVRRPVSSLSNAVVNGAKSR